MGHRFLIQSYYYRPVGKRWGAQATIELDSATGWHSFRGTATWV